MAAARAHTHPDGRGLTGRPSQVDHVGEDVVPPAPRRPGPPAAPRDLVDAQHRLDARRPDVPGDEAVGVPAEHLPLDVARRHVERQLHEEAVELRLGQGVRALELDRVHRRGDEERVRQRSGRAVDADLAFLHRLEECRLRLRGRRFTSSASSTFVNTGPRGTEGAGRRVVDQGTVTSPGMRSGVNWMRFVSSDIAAARLRTSRVFATPGRLRAARGPARGCRRSCRRPRPPGRRRPCRPRRGADRRRPGGGRRRPWWWSWRVTDRSRSCSSSVAGLRGGVGTRCGRFPRGGADGAFELVERGGALDECAVVTGRAADEDGADR